MRARRYPKWLLFLLQILGVVAAGAGYVLLVRAAIDFGRAANEGRSAAWAACVAATLGAGVSLFLGFVLAFRIWDTVSSFTSGRSRRSSRSRRPHSHKRR